MIDVAVRSSLSQMVWRATGCPENKYEAVSTTDQNCATCCVALNGSGVYVEDINNVTFTQQSDFFRFGNHVCPGCAWLYADPKRAHRGVLATSAEVYWPMISAESAANQGRLSWLDALRALQGLPQETVIAGVLTTDPKPRKWPRAELGTRAEMMLLVHNPDWDISGNVHFDLDRCLEIADFCGEVLDAGWSKARIRTGLYLDYARAAKAMDRTAAWEARLVKLRLDPAFVPALLVATKNKKRE